MKIIKPLIIILVLSFQHICAQKKSIMFTYSESSFLYSPGLEFNYFFNPKIGVELGISSYFLDYNPSRLVNVDTNVNHFLHFYNANIGLCGLLQTFDKVALGWTLGWKVYYGPNFKPLHFFENEGYYIYYDSSNGKFNHGLDLGLLSYIQNAVVGIKFDTARNKLRLLVGWSF
tara:strand:+ start:703 stop:1221 length:519 start_codon:yes stop_codon:yes gene_type:complete